eukprot:TRINITY_DN17344_c0_g1_i1.p1 TRINITY_DN17344_c0_g1~~TRINITY_DN17344_c0_g1_i1.p1  ORF type:complete len:295 (+),score=52.58 TRINITY_DN17344_c0_g1_i1:59-943(+)
MGLTDDQLTAGLSYLSSGLGMIGALVLVVRYFHQQRTTFRRMLLCLSLCDLQQAAWFFFVPMDVTGFCYYHALWGVFGDNSTFFWTGAIAFYVAYLFWYGAKPSRRIVRTLWVVGWGLPVLMLAVLMMFGSESVTHDVATSPVPWCFLRYDNVLWEFLVYLGPLFLCWVVSVGCTAIAFGVTYLNYRTVTHVRLRETKTQLVLIPAGFILLRMWPVILHLASFIDDSWAPLWLVGLTVFGLSLQGFVNCLTFAIVPALYRWCRARNEDDDDGNIQVYASPVSKLSKSPNYRTGT